MSALQKSLAIMFADITDSTKLYETVGDERARALTAQSINQISKITTDNKGVVIKTMGDGIMMTFPHPDDAFEASLAMQDYHKDIELSITIGFHFGQVIEESGDVFGDAVNLAARVAGKARSNEILLTQETVELLSPQYKLVTRFLDKASMKGKAQGVNVYSVLTQSDSDATISFASASTILKNADLDDKSSLLLLFQNQEKNIKDGSSYSIGRDKSCDISIASGYASRKHAVISKQRNHFVITDQSTNGTYIKLENGQEMFLKRESAQLVGKGFISLGEKYSKESKNVINYEYKAG